MEVPMSEARFISPAEMTNVEMFPGFRRFTLASGERETLMRFEIETGAEIPLHSHPHEQAGTVVSGRILLRIEGKEQEMGAGSAWIIPGDVPHWAKALEPTVLVECFSPVREDYL